MAAIHGTAACGGLEMVLHCDIRFAAADARLGRPEISIGFIPPGKGLKKEYESAVRLADTKDFSAGIRAFTEKRKPKWK